MSNSAQPFAPPQRRDTWFCAGPVSLYPDITDDARIVSPRNCNGTYLPGCRVFHVPRNGTSPGTEVAVDEWKDPAAGDAKEQVMVFQYKGVFMAVDHECPHASYPLSSGRTFDIEDFGVVLSAGIQCSKHDWSFDLHTGRADRGGYGLNVWEVQRRGEAEGEEIWVRRKQRIG